MHERLSELPERPRGVQSFSGTVALLDCERAREIVQRAIVPAQTQLEATRDSQQARLLQRDRAQPLDTRRGTSNQFGSRQRVSSDFRRIARLEKLHEKIVNGVRLA